MKKLIEETELSKIYTDIKDEFNVIIIKPKQMKINPQYSLLYIQELMSKNKLK